MPSHVCWLGWFAIRPQFRRKCFGSAAIHQLCRTAWSAGSTELWVYTDRHNEVARIFYLSLGFEVLGPASDYAAGKTMDDSDIVLRRILAAS
jgi:ribosomal protein S18 acetylase RimI-like enzyme